MRRNGVDDYLSDDALTGQLYRPAIVAGNSRRDTRHASQPSENAHSTATQQRYSGE